MCFSTLACPTWTLSQVIEIAVSSGYDGVELRFLEGEDSLWKLPAFQGSAKNGINSMPYGPFSAAFEVSRGPGGAQDR